LDVNELYLLGAYITGKNLQQGYYSPEDFHRTINAAQGQYVAFLLGSFQKYTPGRPIANVELGQNSVVRQRLTPVIYGYNLNVDTTGFSPFPGDYLQTDAMWSIYGYQRIRYADQHKLSSIYGSTIDPIANNPIYVLETEGFRFYPQSINSSRLSYVKDPPNMVWGYDEDANGIPVYNPAKSTQPVFDDLALFEILSRALAMVGVNLNAGMVMAYSAEIKNNGQ
jgi:hypothetical protein